MGIESRVAFTSTLSRKVRSAWAAPATCQVRWMSLSAWKDPNPTAAKAASVSLCTLKTGMPRSVRTVLPPTSSRKPSKMPASGWIEL